MRSAVRFPLQMEVVITTPERAYKAVTQNVSSSGALFEGDDLPEAGTQVEFELKMPASVMGGTQDVLLHCLGRIVRRTQTPWKIYAAASIDEYTLKG